ncbi:nitric oxide-associated protein 1 [Epargyreus clarus]|uniref:nitric oxide-associated protein 1 n=1 Tax=Epargyreus clarus TaxID=520877 RepID=UPI003C2E2FE3
MVYPITNILRLCGRTSVLLRFNHAAATNGDSFAKNNETKHNTKDLKQIYEQYKDKILFNSYLESEKLKLGHIKYYTKKLKTAKDEDLVRLHEKSLPPLPVVLQYYVDKDRLLPEENAEDIPESTHAFQLPFAKTTPIEVNDDKIISEADKNDFNIKKSSSIDLQEEFDRSNIKRWMVNYEHFDDTKLSEDVEEETSSLDWSIQYGTPDPNVRISRVPCGGCGALLHCNDPAIPGYLPSELFVGRHDEELKTTECQRCHFLKEYNIALDVTVQPEEYEKLLQSIRYVKSLVLLMVDLLDFPCSLWPGIVDIIGTKRPLFIVANKVDLLPGDSIGYLKRIKESLMTEINKTKLAKANIKHVGLISAKTGYGVENLINAMFKTWIYKGDVFLVGCTNVGKSSLFNALLQSDYCKVQAVDIVKRATVSRWPGTTLNLLKFPINRPSAWKMGERFTRLKAEAKLIKIEKKIRKEQMQGQKHIEMPSLISHIGRTFTDYRVQDENIAEKQTKMLTLNEKHEVFAQSKWFYDTPGVIHPDQVLSLLSTEELLLTIPKTLIRPQSYYLRKGATLFIAGLARVDLVDCTEPCTFTVYCSEHLPLTVTKTEDADEIYDKFLGTHITAVPTGDEERLKNWPGLKKREDLLSFIGEGNRLCCGDIVLSTIAFISVSTKKGSECKMAAWTPEGRGIHKRSPSLLPYAVNLKGKRVRDTPAYRLGTLYTGSENI